MSKCEFCKTELNAMPFICPKCGKHFCSAHKLAIDHECPNMHDAEKEDEGLKAHEKKEAERSKYIEEEVTVIKRRLNNDKPNVFIQFLSFLWSYNLIIFVILLFLGAYYVQANDVYDIKGKMNDFLDKYGLKLVFYGDETLDSNEGLSELAMIDDNEEIEQVTDTSEETVPYSPPDPNISKIKEIIDNPRKYLNTQVELKGYVFQHEFRVGTIYFDYRITDEGGFYIYLLLPQERGFTDYVYYDIGGVIKEENDILYLDVNSIEKS
ncbi:hypothetical protein C0585_03460 [Candidatus Woesearchaeota archaeon]|nr:MAG: hypothetical protein C0585_03460 [Candidatus Woesearchaeota archaeon]